MTEADASEATIQLMYKSYYAEMGGAGTPPEIPVARERAGHRYRQRHRVPPAARPAEACRIRIRPAKPRLPVALIFACLVVVYVGIRYYWR